MHPGLEISTALEKASPFREFRSETKDSHHSLKVLQQARSDRTPVETEPVALHLRSLGVLSSAHRLWEWFNQSKHFRTLSLDVDLDLP